MSMRIILLGLPLFSVTFINAQFDCTNWIDENPNNCCTDCTCEWCVHEACCEGNPNYSASTCTWTGVAGQCGTYDSAIHGPVDNSSGPCASFDENTTGGQCVPIDGGLGFLIAGGLGMGVLGVRRRHQMYVVTEC